MAKNGFWGGGTRTKPRSPNIFASQNEIGDAGSNGAGLNSLRPTVLEILGPEAKMDPGQQGVTVKFFGHRKHVYKVILGVEFDKNG